MKKRQINIQRISETKTRFFEKLYKSDKTLANLIKMKREKHKLITLK
jgi:hypothetical protein